MKVIRIFSLKWKYEKCDHTDNDGMPQTVERNK